MNKAVPIQTLQFQAVFNGIEAPIKNKLSQLEHSIDIKEIMRIENTLNLKISFLKPSQKKVNKKFNEKLVVRNAYRDCKLSPNGNPA